MVGDVLKRTRSLYGFNASEMSSMLGISNSYLSEIENNKKQPPLDLLERYAKVLGIKASSLMLLSEYFDESLKLGRGRDFIARAMVRLVEQLSEEEGVADERP